MMVHQLVPKAEARLFERFYKVSKHDNSNGLGLAITNPSLNCIMVQSNSHKVTSM